MSKCPNCPQSDYNFKCKGNFDKITILDKCIEEQIKIALQSLYEYDEELILRKVHEVCIAHKFALYFQNQNNIIYEKYDMDIEYNRNGLDPKSLCGQNNYVRPDMIIHKRNCNKQNLVIFEFKGHWNNDTSSDYSKLEKFTSPDSFIKNNRKISYGYSLGVHIIFNTDHVKINYFKNGEKEPFDYKEFKKADWGVNIENDK